MAVYELKTLPSPYAPKSVPAGQDPVAAETEARARFFADCTVIAEGTPQGDLETRGRALSTMGFVGISSGLSMNEKTILTQAARQVLHTASPQEQMQLQAALGLGEPNTTGGPTARWLEKACGVATHAENVAALTARVATRQPLPEVVFRTSAGGELGRQRPPRTTIV